MTVLSMLLRAPVLLAVALSRNNHKRYKKDLTEKDMEDTLCLSLVQV